MPWQEELAPRAVWQHFYQLTQIPRPSHHEERISAFLAGFGRGLGLETEGRRGWRRADPQAGLGRDGRPSRRHFASTHGYGAGEGTGEGP